MKQFLNNLAEEHPLLHWVLIRLAIGVCITLVSVLALMAIFICVIACIMAIADGNFSLLWFLTCVPISVFAVLVLVPFIGTLFEQL